MQLILDRDIQVLKTYGAAPYAAGLRKLEKQIKEKQTSVNEKIGVKVRPHVAHLSWVQR
jgi:26S proteasome regulatory subunit T1